jgi:hypothetical protein
VLVAVAAPNEGKVGADVLVAPNERVVPLVGWPSVGKVEVPVDPRENPPAAGAVEVAG